MRAEDYSPTTWQGLQPNQAGVQGQIVSFGLPVPSPVLVDRGAENGRRSYRYRMEFSKKTLLMHFVFDEQDKVMVCDMEAME